MSTIIWSPYIWEQHKKADINLLRRFEDSVGIKYPKDYIGCLIENQGETPEPSEIKIRNGVDNLTVLLHTLNKAEDADHYIYSIYKQHELLKEEHDKLLIPFAKAGGASIFAFDYRKNKTEPPVVYINSDLIGDKAIIPVAKTFTEFLEMLHDES